MTRFGTSARHGSLQGEYDCLAFCASRLHATPAHSPVLDADVLYIMSPYITHSYAQQLSLIFGAASILACLVVLLGGRVKRVSGWRIVAGLMGVQALFLIVSTSLVAHEFNTDDRFFYGSRLGAFILFFFL